MKRVKAILKGRYNRKVIIYLLLCCLVLNTSLPAVLATPQGARPDLLDGGGMSITYKTGTYGHTTLVNVGTTRTIINWDSLDTKGGAVNVRETLAFTQDTLTGSLTDSAVLNRISGPATQFNGDLSAPGMHIFMVNPAGIIFGEGSTINATRLVASGLDMSNDAFKDVLDDVSNQMVFSGGNGQVYNHGTINANNVILVGKKVFNTGSIIASEGLVVMSAGDNVYLAQDGSDVLVELLTDPLNTIDDVQNEGLINAKDGKIVLAAGDTFSRAVSNVGDLAAAGGDVTLQAANVKNDNMIDVSSNTNGGNVVLAGTEGVLLGTGSKIEANAGINGDGGSVTIQTDGLFQLDEDLSISASGGSESGKGGSVTITSDDFVILGDISASPGIKTEEPGKLVINTPNVTIADGASVGETDTLYEEDIEALSQIGTSLIVNAEEGITVKDITDGFQPGEITGQYGSIELHATGADSAITFEDNTDTIRTSLGDIVIEAGSGGIYVGHLTTGKDLSDEKPTPGRIILSTSNGGDITTGDLLIRTGWGQAQIDVDSSGKLTVNGDVIVGSESEILNVPNGQNAHAAVYLTAADTVELNGNVGAYAYGIDDDVTEGDITVAETRILAGTNPDLPGEALINGNVVADAESSTEGTAQAAIEVDATGNIIFADGIEAGAIVDKGDGGSVTIRTDGLFRLNENSSITASGGSGSGKGGSVTITSDDFEILGDISASPENKINEPGKLEINSPSVTIADGANAGETDTLYEDDIEALSQAGTSLVVNAEEGITVKNITDGFAPGEITGQFGNIELHATGENSAVTFADDTDTIRTTLGDIIIEAGSGGIDVGNLITGKDLTDEKPAAGQIMLTTTNAGNIETGDLLIESGWRHAEINVKADGHLTVNGDVKVGSESAILNTLDASAEAEIYLSAGDYVALNGEVYANAHGIEEVEDTTKAYVEILAGGNAHINGDLLAEAKASSIGTADATIKIEAFGDIVFAPGAEAHAIADNGTPTAPEAGPGTEDEEETSPDGDHAQIIINENVILLEDDNFSTPKSVAIEIDVLANDTLHGETIDHYDDLTAGTLTPKMSGDRMVGYTYTPPEDLSVLTFNENGEATVTFTYAIGEKTAAVTITLTNGLPVAVKDLAKTTSSQSVNIDVIINDTDPDLDDILTPIEGTVTTQNGTLVLNENGTFTYTPNKGFVGDDSFTYSATDSFNTTSEVEVNITVSKDPPTITPVSPYTSPAPGLDELNRKEIHISGCPALAKWVAEEIGIDQSKMMQIWVAGSLAATGDIHPYDAYAKLKNAATILQDADGTHIVALELIINEFASSFAPPTEEQMVSIVDAITRNTEKDSYYAIADEYLDALVTYISILNSELGLSKMESIQLVTDKYISRLNQDQNVGVAAFFAACLAALEG